jgi:hypothetical protein
MAFLRAEYPYRECGGMVSVKSNNIPRKVFYYTNSIETILRKDKKSKMTEPYYMLEPKSYQTASIII